MPRHDALPSTAPPTLPASTAEDQVLAAVLAAALLPHFAAAVAGEAGQAVDVADTAKALLSFAAAAGVGEGGGGGAAPSARAPMPATAAGAVASRTGAPAYSVRRVITCATYLRRAHVTGEMAANLLPDMSAWLQPGAARASDNVVEFKRALTVVDAAGGTHQLFYECLISSGQRHARLAAGWGPMMRALGVRQGDAVVLARYGAREDGVLHVRVERGGVGGVGGAGAA